MDNSAGFTHITFIGHGDFRNGSSESLNPFWAEMFEQTDPYRNFEITGGSWKDNFLLKDGGSYGTSGRIALEYLGGLANGNYVANLVATDANGTGKSTTVAFLITLN